MIRRVKEGEITWLPGLSASDIPPLPTGISLHIRRGELGIEAQGRVGAVPLLNGDTLQIIPKVGRINFFRLLFKAEGIQQDLEREYDDFVSYSVNEERNIDSIVARHLMFSAAEIMKCGPKQGRIKRCCEGIFAAGKIEVVPTILNLACRKQEPVVYLVRERTLDIPENRVLTAAIMRAWPALEEVDRFELRRVWERWLMRFSQPSNLDADLEKIEQRFATGQYGGARDYYRRALMLAQIVLGGSGLGLNDSTTVEGDAILLNTANIFEKYLRSIISASYSDAGYIVSKGGVGVKSLYINGSFELEPDICITKNGRIVLIADAKYKKPTSLDHYQMHTYLVANGLKQGLLLAPLYEGNDVVIREYATTQKILIREIYLPMGDLDITEKFLQTVIEKYS